LTSEKVSVRNAERARSNRRERRRKKEKEGEKEQEWYKVDNATNSIQKVIICYNISKQC
jgi:hypothetical protein